MVERISESQVAFVVARVVRKTVENLESRKLSINRVIIAEEILDFEMDVKSVDNTRPTELERETNLFKKYVGTPLVNGCPGH